MERTRRWMIAFMFMLIVTSGLFSAGCAKKSISADGWPVRYQDVQIPGYKTIDYINLLDTDHEASRYNAICNVIPHAREYGELLSTPPAGAPAKPKEAVDEAALQTARRVYDRMKAQIGGSSESCKAVALIFLAEFAATYSEEQEIVDLLLSVETKDARTQYEQLNVLKAIYQHPHLIDPAALKPFLDSPAWIVKAMTYALLEEMPCDALHPRLVREYARSALESDKILIIHAFGKGYGGEVFDLLRHEIQASGNQRLKGEWAGILKVHRDEAETLRWLTGENTVIDDLALKSIVESYRWELDNTKGQRFFKEIILSRQTRWIHAMDPEKFYRNLYSALADKQKTEALAQLEAAVLDSDQLKEEWRAHQARYDQEARERRTRDKQEDHFTKSTLPKYNLLLKAFLKETEKLFLAEGMDRLEVEETTESIRELLDLTKEEQ
jgi:hypothetical protein